MEAVKAEKSDFGEVKEVTAVMVVCDSRCV
jgi:hypothetical protein